MNPRIPEIVKILANLIQELDNAQENRESLEVLGRIKLYSAQLYLETDMEIIALNRDDLDEEVEFEDDEFSTNTVTSLEIEQNSQKIHNIIESIELNNSVEFNTPEEEEIEVEFYPMEEPAETEEFEIEFMDDEEKLESEENERQIEFKVEENDDEELEVEDFDEEEDNDEFEKLDENDDHVTDIINQDLVVVAEDEVVELSINQQPEIELSHFFPTPKNSSDENSLINDLQNSQQEKPRQPELFNQSADLDAHKVKAQEILGMFSLSRRFEFANLLFAGDMQQFILFLCEVLAAPNSDAREDVIDGWYEKNQWRRKDETASDLKRNLRKML